ncbi:TPA: serine/threonine-protein kinase [Clostridium perfringens]|uniref:serine/threonine-protein kinase n=1 Tax=Clostridium perfringens TaxID=1502 RepID=UPI00115AABA7|nr:serine/threonine-protein kinase [Clostridium perfringens]EGT0683282.1 serine/threonine protein kinase [Clostridium perfringens]EGT0685712.1 serine/threonine protein kinase [Clostridium perfringens]EHA6440840.1 serine/threonine protein kinase [Clostridium perfringens]MDM0967801.1 serine/threonine-protein kinase [Clostridium perfringens]MDU6193831.1 serine/threonine-protein kinase [Clostridium perfringens]
MENNFISNLKISDLETIFPNLNILQIIKAGGEGVVIKTSLKENNEVLLALKIYDPEHLSKRNELEVQKLSNLDSPYIINLYSYGTVMLYDKQCFFTLTSYVDGPDLRTLLKEGYNFNSNEVKTMLICISQAIQTLWDEKVVHCDIKPDNILYDKSNNKFILIDLGIAKYLDEPTMTSYGIIMGTLGYIAPEQIQGRKNLTLKTDFYSLGIVAYELLVGHHPFNFNQDLIMQLNPLPSIPNTIVAESNLKKLIFSLANPIAYKRPFNFAQINTSLKEVF